ncbi:hypothetical protein [Jeotgalibaca caeni]|uniref:hypothetical protein n=1 Tax=Jeotgalibaca caeni TaxID=3028623 RepID=UPI00237E90A8|nr:hypothetical protein [Jeotgalibaca caeni]MDE1549267.1 hypothetical protein [Jeotgalibaca caeni]
MDIALQEAYIEQYMERKSKKIFEENGKNLLGQQWHLVDYYRVGKKESLKCEYPHEGGGACGRGIMNIYTIQSESGILLKVGKDCLNKTVIVNRLDNLVKERDLLRDKVKRLNSQYSQSTLRSFTNEDKKRAVAEASKLGLLPEDVRELLKAGVPLLDGVYQKLEENVEMFRRNKLRLEQEKAEQARKNQPIKPTQTNRQEPTQKRFNIPKITEDVRKQQRQQMTVSRFLKQQGPKRLESEEDLERACDLCIQAHLFQTKGDPVGKIAYSNLMGKIAFYYNLSTDKKRWLHAFARIYVFDLLRDGYDLEVIEESKGDFTVCFN